jgi:hypothetical protein
MREDQVAKKKQKIELVVDQKERKKNPPRTAFAKGNPYRVQPGQVLNPRGGKPKDEHRLVSKALRVQLNTRAPDAYAKALHLPRGASWAQCLAASLLRRSVAGDMSAATLIVQTVEGTKSHIEFSDESTGGRRECTVLFMESDGDGRPIRTLPTTIDGALADEPSEPSQIAAP